MGVARDGFRHDRWNAMGTIICLNRQQQQRELLLPSTVVWI